MAVREYQARCTNFGHWESCNPLLDLYLLFVYYRGLTHVATPLLGENLADIVRGMMRYKQEREARREANMDDCYDGGQGINTVVGSGEV